MNASRPLVIVDCGIGNIRSIQSKLAMIGIESLVSHDAQEIERAEKLILPGVGNFATGARKLRESGVIPALSRAVLEKKAPILGICLGMQLLGRGSEEGNEKGLGWLDADVLRFRFPQLKLRVPHVGWNTIEKRSDSPLFLDLPLERPFYFTHSYYMVSRDPAAVAATCRYGLDFVAAVQKGNIFGTQFHPEKSRMYGLKLIENFARVS